MSGLESVMNGYGTLGAVNKITVFAFGCWCEGVCVAQP